MQLIKINKRAGIEQNEKLKRKFDQFDELLTQLRMVNLKSTVSSTINEYVDVLNNMEDEGKKFGKQLSVIQSKIVTLVEKEQKLVTIGHYRNTWMPIGMAAFGIPMGAIFGIIMGNMAFLAIGLPIGIAIGIAVGMSMDNKALTEGRQLDIEIKY